MASCTSAAPTSRDVNEADKTAPASIAASPTAAKEGRTLTITKKRLSDDVVERQLTYSSRTRTTPPVGDGDRRPSEALQTALAERRTLELLLLDLVDELVGELRRLGKDVSAYESQEEFDADVIFWLLGQIAKAKEQGAAEATTLADKKTKGTLTEAHYQRLKRAVTMIKRMEAQVKESERLNRQLLTEIEQETARQPGCKDGDLQRPKPIDETDYTSNKTTVNTVEAEALLRQIRDFLSEAADNTNDTASEKTNAGTPGVECSASPAASMGDKELYDLLQTTETELITTEKYMEMLRGLGSNFLPHLEHFEQDALLLAKHMRQLRDQVSAMKASENQRKKSEVDSTTTPTPVVEQGTKDVVVQDKSKSDPCMRITTPSEEDFRSGGHMKLPSVSQPVLQTAQSSNEPAVAKLYAAEPQQPVVQAAPQQTAKQTSSKPSKKDESTVVVKPPTKPPTRSSVPPQPPQVIASRRTAQSDQPKQPPTQSARRQRTNREPSGSSRQSSSSAQSIPSVTNKPQQVAKKTPTKTEPAVKRGRRSLSRSRFSTGAKKAGSVPKKLPAPAKKSAKRGSGANRGRSGSSGKSSTSAQSAKKSATRKTPTTTQKASDKGRQLFKRMTSAGKKNNKTSK